MPATSEQNINHRTWHVYADPYRAGVVDVATVRDEVGLIYLVEFPSGEAFEVAEAHLEVLAGDDITAPPQGP